MVSSINEAQERLNIRDIRRAPFAWQSKKVKRFIRQHFSGRRLTTAIAIYDTLTELASNAQSETFIAKRKTIAAWSGVKLRTAQEYLNEFLSMGILVKRARKAEGILLANEWRLTEPDETLAQDSNENALVVQKAPNETDTNLHYLVQKPLSGRDTSEQYRSIEQYLEHTPKGGRGQAASCTSNNNKEILQDNQKTALSEPKIDTALVKNRHCKRRGGTDPTVSEIFAEMRKYLGHPERLPQDPIPSYGKEGQAIKRMLVRGFTPENILTCWKDKVSRRGGEFVSMIWVNEDIAKQSYGKDGRFREPGQYSAKANRKHLEPIESGPDEGLSERGENRGTDLPDLQQGI